MTQYLWWAASYNLVSVPVVDTANRLVGAVTVDDVLDFLLPEDWRSHDDDAGHAPQVGGAAAGAMRAPAPAAGQAPRRQA